MNTIHTAPSKFILLIKEIASAYSFDLSLKRACLHLSRDVDNLIIEKLDSKIIRVGQYKQNGRLIHPSPELEFIIEELAKTSDDQHTYWTPLRVCQGLDFRQVAWINSEGLIIDVNTEGLRETAVLCGYWADRLFRQYWSIYTHPASGVTATFQYISDNLRGIKIFTH